MRTRSRNALASLGLSILLSGSLTAASLSRFFEKARGNYVTGSRDQFIEISSRDIRIGPRGANLRWHKADEGVLAGENPTGGFSRYLVGSDEARWRTFVPHYSRVRVGGLYPNTDITYYFQGAHLEFDVTLRPGSNPNVLQFSTPGASHLSFGDSGDLVLEAGGQDYRLRSPPAYQMRDGVREPVACRYALDAHGRVGFRLGTFDRSRDLVIDPVVEWLTYLGGSGIDHIQAIAADTAGNVVVAV